MRKRAEHVKPSISRIPGARRLWGALLPARLSVLKWIYGEAYHEDVFGRMWRENSWGDAESRSGTGSNLMQTAFLRDALPKLLQDLRVRFLLDIPCGDFRWMKEVHLPRGLVYVGADIIEQIVTTDNDKYADNTISFLKRDILRDALPKADLVLCRDCLVHFSFADIFGAICNLKRSGSKYLLVTHFADDRQNSDIITGQWRPLNLTRAPFKFPPPRRVIDERCTEAEGRYRDKELALWRLEDLPCPSNS